MASYRDGLAKIGIGNGQNVSYRSFASTPASLRQAIQSMDAPTSDEWKQVSDIARDEFWTDEVQGVAYDGANWIFSANANQSKPGHNDKAIYVFPAGSQLKDGQWSQRIDYKNVLHPIASTENSDHWGQLCWHEGSVYVAHFWQDGPKKGRGNVVVFRDSDGVLAFDRWIELEQVPDPAKPDSMRNVEFQAINPWDGTMYACLGGGAIDRFFIFETDGRYTGRSLRFEKPLLEVQGACFTPNGHLYVSTDTSTEFVASHTTPLLSGSAVHDPHPRIWYFSPLNGHLFGAIGVLAEESGQELEGVCYGAVEWSDGRRAQIHAVLLENRDAALDNIFFKSFSCARPELV